jgi:hypothetical protein
LESARRGLADDTRTALWVHKTANVLNKLSKSLHSKANWELHEIWMAETNADGLKEKTYVVKHENAVTEQLGQAKFTRTSQLVMLQNLYYAYVAELVRTRA